MRGDGIIGQLERQLIQAELALLLFRSVTGYAMLFQKTPDLLRIQTNRLSRDRAKEASQSQKGQDSKNAPQRKRKM